MDESWTVIDLFAGAGGLSEGFKRAGFDVVLAVDSWGTACETYRANHPRTSVWHRDIAFDLHGEDLMREAGLREPPTVVIGGPPCQGFSTLGKRLHKDDRNALVWEFARLVAELRPRWFLMENVDGMRLAKWENRELVDALLSSFADAGFWACSGAVVSAHYGVPQLRRRLFLIGNREDVSFQFPRPTHLLEDDFVTVWQAIGDLPRLRSGESARSYARGRPTEFQRFHRNGSGGVTLHEASNHPARLLKAIRHIPDGGDRADIPKHLQPTSGFHNSYSRFASNRPAVAITTVTGKISTARSLHPFDDRAITPREAARLQSFSDDYVFHGPRWEIYAQIGNSVPPLLAETFARHIRQYLLRPSYEPSSDCLALIQEVVRDARATVPRLRT